MENGKFYGRPFTDLVDKRQDGQHWETNFYPRLLIKTEYSSPKEKILWTQYWGQIYFQPLVMGKICRGNNHTGKTIGKRKVHRNQ